MDKISRSLLLIDNAVLIAHYSAEFCDGEHRARLSYLHVQAQQALSLALHAIKFCCEQNPTYSQQQLQRLVSVATMLIKPDIMELPYESPVALVKCTLELFK